MVAAHHDFETASACDLRVAGAYRYAEDPTTRIWMMSWRIGDGPVQRWHPGEPEPREFLAHVAAGGMVGAHNAAFERSIWNTTLLATPRCRHWPRLRIAQQDCTMSRGLAVHLPADLDGLGQVLGLETTKDKEGGRLMMKMAKPRKVHEDGTITWWDAPENVARLGAYCDVDVEVESEVDRRLPPLSADERELWERDQAINDRGVCLDVATIGRAVAVKEIALRRADARMVELTGGAVRRCTESGRIVAWLAERGIPCDSIARDEHAELRALAEAFGDDAAAEVIGLRSESTKTSTAKLDKMLAMVCADGRARGLFNYHRALTGRWGGSQCQPQNLPRVDEERELPGVLAAIDAMEIFS